MSYFVKAKRVFYDPNKGTHILAGDVIVNMDHIIKFERANGYTLENSERPVFLVDTSVDNTGYSLKLVSDHLESLMEYTK